MGTHLLVKDESTSFLPMKVCSPTCISAHLYLFLFQNPDISVDERNAVNLNYITYIGSSLSVLFAFISLFFYVGLQ